MLQACNMSVKGHACYSNGNMHGAYMQHECLGDMHVTVTLTCMSVM